MSQEQQQERAEITGNVANKPELRFTQTGKPVANFAVYENSFGRNEETGKIERRSKRTRVTCWEDLAEACSSCLDKGVRVTVKGVLRPRTWTDSHGEVHDEIELVARSVEQQ